MAAPSAGQSVTITVGTVWTLQVKPPSQRPQRIPIAVVVLWVVLSTSRVLFGFVYFQDCPQQPNIPVYLLGLGLMPLIVLPFVTLPCESDPAQRRQLASGFAGCLLGLIGLFPFMWILAGDVWVFSVYQPNYDPSAADGLYCNKTLYTFAFWNAAYDTFGIGVLLAGLCKRLLCFVTMRPARTNTDFYGHV
ncbi:transmembrane protein 272-like isoform X1 [Brachyistius frenatus]|uniref:transmembrane protein 272-like isoform X1 n=1 Tax=Brachyistius frenatus TaxID=100188 RepID=UPI0037E83088